MYPRIHINFKYVWLDYLPVGLIYFLQLLVNEDWIARSILHLVEKERFVVEGAGACPLATIIGNLVPELKLKKYDLF